MATNNKLTDKAKAVLAYLQTQEVALTGKEIAEATGLNPAGIHGVLNSLVKRSLVAKGDSVIAHVTNAKGLSEDRSYVTYVVTEEGLAYTEAE